MLPSQSSRGPPADAQLLCGFASHLCGREKLAGHDFCLRHILDDRSAPFKPCNFTFNKTNPPRRCPRPAPKSDRKDGYCIEHSRRALMAKQKSSSRKRPSSSGGTAKLLDDLAHYKLPKKEESVPEIKQEVGVDQKQQDVLDNLARRIPSMSQRALDGSEQDSDDEPQTVDATWNGNDDNSDAESIDSELDNPLKHAGKYSAEEVVRIMREKLIRLQKLYVDQFQRLRYLLGEEGRKYKHGVLAEKEAGLSSIHSQIKGTIDDLTSYDKIKALNHYQRPQGIEAVLHHAFLERRHKLGDQNSTSTPGSAGGGGASSTPFKPTVLPKCSYHITSSTKCGEVVIPLSKYCIKHVLEDNTQVLFRTCGFVVNSTEDLNPSKDGPCETPIPDVLEGNTCIFHSQFQSPFASHEDKVTEVKKQEMDEVNVTEEVKIEVKNEDQ